MLLLAHREVPIKNYANWKEISRQNRTLAVALTLTLTLTPNLDRETLTVTACALVGFRSNESRLLTWANGKG